MSQQLKAKPKSTSPQEFALELTSISVGQLLHQIGIDRVQGAAHAVLVRRNLRDLLLFLNKEFKRFAASQKKLFSIDLIDCLMDCGVLWTVVPYYSLMNYFTFKPLSNHVFLGRNTWKLS